jgi:hypothetical protein
MALDKSYKGIPGTTIFDTEQARKGFHLNQFCMSPEALSKISPMLLVRNRPD